jgi:hypothetical protein
MQNTLFIERTHSIECSPLDTLASGDAEACRWYVDAQGAIKENLGP